MNDRDRELKLQAYLDGELSSGEAAEVERWLAQDPTMQALGAELRHTRQLVREHEPVVTCPESRDFYWSQIARQIESADRVAARQSSSVASAPWWRRWVLPLGACAALALTVWSLQKPGLTPVTGTAREIARSVADAEIELTSPEMGALTFTDHTVGVTLVWHYDRQNDI